jgi:hypothetical protein
VRAGSSVFIPGSYALAADAFTDVEYVFC